MQEFEVKRLRTKSIFKLIFAGLVLSLVPLFAVAGILASMGLVNLYWGGQALTGGKAIIAGPFIGLFISVVFSIFVSMFVSLGLIIYGKKRTLKLYYHPLENRDQS